MPNAVEEGRFEREPDPNPALADPTFAGILAKGKPIAGYYGALARWFDYELLRETARLRPDWSFVLIGPDHDGSLARSKLDRLPNVHWLGPRPYLALPGYLHRFDVATIPFAINDITLATSPLKLYEYFAAGRPVISTPMPECAAFAEVSDRARRHRVRGGARRSPRAGCRDPRSGTAADDRRRRTRGERGRAKRCRRSRSGARARFRGDRGCRLARTAMPRRCPDDARAAACERIRAARNSLQNRHFFRALAAHLAGSRDDPVPAYVLRVRTVGERARARGGMR